jgi:1,4-dihydroxy-2-naphthoate octaprenyltransferase
MLPLKNKKSLREFGWVKIIILTAVWTIVTSVLPMLYHQVPLAAYPFEILLRFVFLFTLCVAFDIRDMQTDLEAGISTLPNLIGIKNSYRLMDIALVLFAVLSVVQYFRYPSAVRLGGELVAAIVTRLVIQYSKYHASDRVYLGLVDGMMLLYAALVLMH